MVNILGIQIVEIKCYAIEWAPRNWQDRAAWGPQAADGFYLTKDGEIYRLVGKSVIYVTQREHLH